VLASNGLKIVLDTSIRYHIVGDEAVKLDSELGVHYYSTLLGPTLRSQARRVVGRYQPEEIYSTQREAIERQVREGIEAAIKGRHIVLEAVLIRNVELPTSIQQAINNKLEAEQHALKMQFVIAQAKAEEEKRLMEVKAEAEQEKIRAETVASAHRIAAQSDADASRIRAQADADGKRLDGAATADYQKAVTKYLTDLYLRWQQIEATKALAGSGNSKLVFIGGAGAVSPILDLRGGGHDPYAAAH